MRSRLLFLLLAAAVARAETTPSGALQFARVPLSVRQQAAGSYGTFDVLKAFSNPAILSYQPRRWEVGLSNQMMFDGAQNLWGAGASWAADMSDSGAYGAALLLSGVSSEAVEEINVLGEATGISANAAGFRAGLAGFFRWNWLSIGAGVSSASETVSGVKSLATAPATSALFVDAGVMGSFGPADLGVAYRNRGSEAGGALALGAAYKVSGFARGAIGADMELPMGGLGKPVATVGITWSAHRMLDLRVGALVPTGVSGAGGLSARAGLTVYWNGFALDYAFAPPLGDGPGMAHLIGLGASFGAVRQIERKGPSFALTQKERTMAVAGFDAQGVSATDAAVVSDLLRSALVKEGTFNIVEKGNMDAILREQAFQQTGCTTQECAVKLGKVLNVKYLVVGGFSKSLGEYLVTMRVVDIETARIVYTDEFQGTSLREIRQGVNEVATRLTEAVKKAR